MDAPTGLGSAIFQSRPRSSKPSKTATNSQQPGTRFGDSGLQLDKTQQGAESLRRELKRTHGELERKSSLRLDRGQQ